MEAWTRVDAPCLVIALRTWVSTVDGDTASAREICFVVRPRATRTITSWPVAGRSLCAGPPAARLVASARRRNHTGAVSSMPASRPIACWRSPARSTASAADHWQRRADREETPHQPSAACRKWSAASCGSSHAIAVVSLTAARRLAKPDDVAAMVAWSNGSPSSDRARAPASAAFTAPGNPATGRAAHSSAVRTASSCSPAATCASASAQSAFDRAESSLARSTASSATAIASNSSPLSTSANAWTVRRISCVRTDNCSRASGSISRSTPRWSPSTCSAIEQTGRSEVPVPRRRCVLGELDHVRDERGAHSWLARQQLPVDHRVVHGDGVVQIGFAHRQSARSFELRRPSRRACHQARQTERAVGGHGRGRGAGSGRHVGECDGTLRRRGATLQIPVLAGSNARLEAQEFGSISGIDHREGEPGGNGGASLCHLRDGPVSTGAYELVVRADGRQSVEKVERFAVATGEAQRLGGVACRRLGDRRRSRGDEQCVCSRRDRRRVGDGRGRSPRRLVREAGREQVTRLVEVGRRLAREITMELRQRRLVHSIDRSLREQVMSGVELPARGDRGHPATLQLCELVTRRVDIVSSEGSLGEHADRRTGQRGDDMPRCLRRTRAGCRAARRDEQRKRIARGRRDGALDVAGRRARTPMVCESSRARARQRLQGNDARRLR